MEQEKNNRCFFLICAALVLVTAAVYWQVSGYGFVNYDDPDYAQKNMHVLRGITSEGFLWAFTDTKTTGNWHPLTWLSLMLDCQLFGPEAKGFHITNVLFHIFNTLLLFIVLMRMTGSLWASAFVAAAFALHPLHVESVAWISERKDVLSTFFWLLTMLAYVCYVERPRLAGYAAIVLFFVLGLMAKPMLVTLPFALLLMDYWPMKRLRVNESSDTGKSAAYLAAEKIPLFVVAVIFCVLTYLAQQSGKAVSSIEAMPLKVRLANAMVSYSSYIGKMIWPGRLALFYPHHGMPSIRQLGLAILVLAAISAAIIWKHRGRPYLVVGWLWYVGTLVPVIGLVQVGEQSMADRYTYVPLIGLFIIIAWATADYMRNRPSRRITLGISAAVVLSALTLCTLQQIGYWQNSVVLFEHTLSVTRNNFAAHLNLGMALAKQGELDRAIEHHRRALQLRPGDAMAHINMGMELALQHKNAEAIKHYQEALRIDPNQPVAYNNLGAAMLSMGGDINEVMEQFRRALQIKPDYANARLNLASMLMAQGKFDEAKQHYRQILQFNPNDTQAQQGLRIATAEQNKPADSRKMNKKPKFETILSK